VELVIILGILTLWDSMKERSSAVAAEFMSPMASIPKGRPIRQDGQHSELGSAIIVIKIPAAWS
jgi:hypothetical protein